MLRDGAHRSSSVNLGAGCWVPGISENSTGTQHLTPETKLMVIGILTIALEIPGANSLKDKRQVLKSLIENIRNKFNVSAAEVGDNDVWRRAVIGIACVSNDNGMANRMLDKVGDYIESNPLVNVTSVELEFL